MNIYVYIQGLILVFILFFLFVEKADFNGRKINNKFFNYFNIFLLLFLLLANIYSEPIIIKEYVIIFIEIILFLIVYFYISSKEISNTIVIKLIEKKSFWFYYIYKFIYYIFYLIILSVYLNSFYEDIKLKNEIKQTKDLSLEKYKNYERYSAGYFTENFLLKEMNFGRKENYYILLKIYKERYLLNKDWPRYQNYYRDKILSLNASAFKIFPKDKSIVYMYLLYRYLFLNNLNLQEQETMVAFNNSLNRNSLSQLPSHIEESYTFLKFRCNNIDTDNVSYIKSNANQLVEVMKIDKCTLKDKNK